MKSIVVWFEIPVVDMERAKTFYEKLTGLTLTLTDMGESLMAMFPMEGYANGGALMKHEQSKPSCDGVTIYLDAGDDLQPMLDRVEPAGGKIVVPKTHICEEYGWFAIFTDTEGNSIGLWSPK
ncbi:MAG: VOC family protein [Candidatus Cloacimonetes bacterium]|nr:VOC family protein [Candidatus Cloacimonadota bacterium]